MCKLLDSFCVEQAEIAVENKTTMMEMIKSLRFVENILSLRTQWLNNSVTTQPTTAQYGGKAYAPNGL